MDGKPRALILASVASMIDQFNLPNIQLLIDKGYDVDVVCNCKEGNTISDERIQTLILKLEAKGVSVIHTPIPRRITDVSGIWASYIQVKQLCDINRYALLHCHSPIGSVIARLAAAHARKSIGTKVIYTAHGFHFYKGAPWKNWAIFFPIEKACSRVTDILITINKEDYAFARKHMNAKRVEYIPGVGVDTEQFKVEDNRAQAKRDELGVASDEILILSIGELNQNKNHEVIIRAIANLKNPKIHYFIAGKGDKEQYLTDLAKTLGVDVHLLGYRTDVIELLSAADIFALPSFREGLSVSLMEAMAAGLPCIASDIRGNVDLIDQNGGYICPPNDISAFSRCFMELVNPQLRISLGAYNQRKVKKYDTHTIIKMLSPLYEPNKILR